MKKKIEVLIPAAAVIFLASLTAAGSETAISPEAAVMETGPAGEVRSRGFEFPAEKLSPEETGPPGRCAGCLTTPALLAPADGGALTTIAPLFQWDLHNDPEATGMQLWISLNAGFSPLVTSMNSSQPTGEGSYRWSDNFSPATTYYWRVRLVCGGENGPWSETRSFTSGSGGTLPAAPAPISPYSGAAVPLGSSTVRLSWSAVAGTEDYLVRRVVFGRPGSYVSTQAGTFVELYDLDENTTYEWWVRARNSYGYGAESARRQFRQPLVLESGDYDGDGSGDIAVFRDSTGLWAVRGVTRFYFGSDYDIPVSGDYDGDGTARPAVFRPGSGLWAVRGLTRFYFGGEGDLPIPADYDGDGSCDAGIFRGGNGLWALRGLTRFYYGVSGDAPVPGDLGLGGPARPALFRASTGLWAIRSVTRGYYGTGGDWPVPGDYFGEDSAPAVFRGSSGLWAVMSRTRLYFGGGADAPVPADYDGAAGDNPAIFRDSTGLWAVRGVTRVYFGKEDDLPVTR